MLILFSLIISSVFYYCICFFAVCSAVTFASVICSSNKESSSGARQDVVCIVRSKATQRKCYYRETLFI